ncbi:hypothetical protein [Sanyastnella coralliicola]|uniref:hypothetical protein n=1 Tax=Sanyastnella coralliicola TaxID=3069118 RepID=UPI0027B97877|nr:hypothetical protein [Longitalea sp. SCSIO 12813]
MKTVLLSLFTSKNLTHGSRFRGSVFLVLVLLSFFGCKDTYEINEELLRCNYRLYEGFRLSELDVKQFDDNGIPLQYEAAFTVLLNTNQDYNPAKKGREVIYFTQPNGPKHQAWYWRVKGKQEKSLVLPLSFKKQQWYVIDFSHRSCHTDNLFFYFENNGEVRSFHENVRCEFRQ